MSPCTAKYVWADFRANLAAPSTMASASLKEAHTTNTNFEAMVDEPTPSDQHPSMSPTRRRTVIFTLCMTVFLSALDVTIIATALPRIAAHLDASAAQYVWIGSSYTLASTSLTPIWGKVSEIWGGKSMLVLAVIIFLAGSLVAALSTSVSMLIGGRVIQGLGGGGISILVSILIGHLFPLRERPKYYGLTAIVYAVASGLGPVLGGVFTQAAGWRWCFFINLPTGGFALGLLVFLLKVPSPGKPFAGTLRTIDWGGSILIVGGTIMLLYGLEFGSGGLKSWSSPLVIGLLVSGMLALILFSLYEWHIATDPVVPVKIFATRATMATLGVAACHAIVFIAYDYFLPLYFQSVLGLVPITSGLLLFALVVPMSIMASATGFFVKRTGAFRLAMWFGLGVMTLGTGLFISLDAHIVWAKVIIFQIIAGVGAGPLFQSPLIALQTHLKPSEMAPGTSGLTFLRSLCTSVSIVVGGVLLQHGLDSQTFLSNREDGPTSTAVSKGVYVSALGDMWIFYTLICGLGLFFALLVPRKVQHEGDPDDETQREGEKADAALDERQSASEEILNEKA